MHYTVPGRMGGNPRMHAHAQTKVCEPAAPKGGSIRGHPRLCGEPSLNGDLVSAYAMMNSWEDFAETWVQEARQASARCAIGGQIAIHLDTHHMPITTW